jgi:hypothetical protein
MNRSKFNLSFRKRFLAAVLAVAATVATMSPATAKDSLLDEDPAKPAEGAPAGGVAVQGAPAEGAPVVGEYQPNPVHNASTENMNRLANAMRHTHKSVSSIVTVPAGLNLTNPIEISIGYGGPRITQSYVNHNGNRFLHNFYSGAPRWEYLDVTLRETVPNGEGQPPSYPTYSFRWEIYLEPLYNISISPLTVNLLNSCDTVGSSELLIKWSDSKGGYHSLEPSMSSGDRRTLQLFSEHHTEVSQRRDLRVPSIVIYELDPGYHFQPPHGRSEERLLPGETRTVEWDGAVNNSAGGSYQCSVNYHYTIRYGLQYYYDL